MNRSALACVILSIVLCVSCEKKNKKESDCYLELLRTGRKQFSIIVLNENLEIMGETLFPEYTFNPNLFMVLEDGLYLSTSHIKNPNYSDNELCFHRIDLIKQR